jgi:hypothetical protein
MSSGNRWRWSRQVMLSCLLCILFIYVFIAVLWFELRALSLLGRHSITWAEQAEEGLLWETGLSKWQIRFRFDGQPVSVGDRHSHRAGDGRWRPLWFVPTADWRHSFLRDPICTSCHCPCICYWGMSVWPYQPQKSLWEPRIVSEMILLSLKHFEYNSKLYLQGWGYSLSQANQIVFLV